MYVSIHGHNEFPYYSGFAAERGEGPGQDLNLNLPIELKSSFDVYMQAVATAIDAIATRNPDYLVISLGFDTYRNDPLGTFDIDVEDYEKIARRARRGSLKMGPIPSILLLEGGYVYDKLGPNVLSFLKGWEAGWEQVIALGNAKDPVKTAHEQAMNNTARDDELRAIQDGRLAREQKSLDKLNERYSAAEADEIVEAIKDAQENYKANAPVS